MFHLRTFNLDLGRIHSKMKHSAVHSHFRLGTLCSIAFVISFVFVILQYDTFGYSVYPPADPEYIPKSKNRLETIRICIVKQLSSVKDPIWKWIYISVLRCTQNRLTNFNLLKFPTDKVFVPLRHNSTRSPCVLLTLGIGNETLMEDYMKQRYYPHCRFYGADPVMEVGRKYSSLGDYYPLAIDVERKKLNLHIMGDDRKYALRTVETTPLHNFLYNTVKEPVIHFVSMDIEGSEYRFLPYLTSGQFEEFNGSIRNVSICQIMFELHGPLKNYSITRMQFEERLMNFLKYSPFVIISAYRPLYHHRFLAVNARDDVCIDQLDFTDILGTKLPPVNSGSIQTILKVVVPNEPDHYFSE